MDHHTLTLSSQGHSEALLDLDDCTPDHLIEPTRHKRNTINEIGRALLATAPEQDRALYERLASCSTSVTSYQGQAVFHNRCNHRLCALCGHLKAKRKLSQLLGALPLLDFHLIDDPCNGGERAIAVKLTLDAGKSHHINHLESAVDALHLAVRRFKDSRRIKPHLLGYHRATEITLGRCPDDLTSITAHPHAHCTFIMRLGDSDRDSMIAHVRRAHRALWRQIVSRANKAHGLNTEIELSHMAVEGLTRQTSDDLRSWITYCSKGAVPDLARIMAEDQELSIGEKAQAWRAISQAIKGKRLHASGGAIKAAIDAHKTARKEERARRIREETPGDRERAYRSRRDRQRTKTDHDSPRNRVISMVWSDVRQRWIDRRLWTQQHVFHTGLMIDRVLGMLTPDHVIHVMDDIIDGLRHSITERERVRDKLSVGSISESS